MNGDADFITTAWPAAWTNITGAFTYKVAGSNPTLLVAGSGGYVGYWSGSAWVELRNSLSTTAWWCPQQYGSDLFITNPTDGIYRYDANTLVPIGAKPIAQMESDEASLWTGETADTTNYREGAQSMYAESTGAAVNMVYTPTTNFNAVTGRGGARDYVSDKSPGTDYYHFKVMFSNTGTIDTTNTRVLLTDGDGDTLNFPYTTWDSDRSATTLTNPPVATTWYDVYLLASEGTDSATFDATNIDTFTFSVDTSSGTLRMNIDDLYVQYAVTMPAVQFLSELKNILWGANVTGSTNAYHFSPVGAPDEYTGTATNTLKSDGESITALKRFYNQLTIPTDNHVFSISGSVVGQTYPSYIFDVNEVTDEAGCSSHRSIIKAKNALWWWWQKQLCRYNGTSVDKISYPVDVTLAAVDSANLDLIVGCPFRRLNQLWWSYPTDSLIRYDLETNAFLPTAGLVTPNIIQTYVSGVETLLTFENTTRKVKKQGQTSVYSFADTAIAATWELPPLMMTASSLQWMHTIIQYLTNTGDITVSYRTSDHLRALEAASFATLDTITQSAPGELGKITINENAVWCQLRITTSGVRAEIQPPIFVIAKPDGGELRAVFP